jgi:hypothetical protein
MRRRWFLLAVLAVCASGSTLSQPKELPRQDLVFVIDNSGSMEGADPLRLRGVAAGLVLDAAQLAAKVEAGLVLFSDSVTPYPLQDPDKVREKLQADQIPPSAGGTNMQAALEAAFELLRTSTAPTRRIVMITDGTPADGSTPASGARQAEVIRNELVGRAVGAGIQLYALGLSDSVDEAFLREVTAATGGRTEISRDHSQLLEKAKQLLGDRDDVFTLERGDLQGTELEYRFELPPGVDRARVTAILDDPRLFAPGQITFDLPGASGQLYRVHFEGRDYAAAWTGFLSSPGTFTLRVKPDKPGFSDTHRGLQVFVEALSVLDVEVSLAPAQRSYTFGDEVKVDVFVATGSGSLQPRDFQLTGEVESGPGATAIPFNGAEGRFQVPDVPGRHTVAVKVTTSGKLGSAQAEASYAAVAPDAVELRTDRPKIEFDAPFGGEEAEVRQGFKVYFEDPEGAGGRRVTVTAQLEPPPGLIELAQLRSAGGTTLDTSGSRAYPLPPEGLELELRLAMDPDRPFAVREGRQEGAIRIVSPQAAADLVIPFRVEIRRPVLEVSGAPGGFALWWDPVRPRRVALGRVETDASIDTALRFEVAEKISAPGGGAEIATLDLALGRAEDPIEPRTEGQRRVLEDVTLRQGEELPLYLRVEPSPTAVPPAASRQEIAVAVRSSLGVETTAVITAWHLGAPWWTWRPLGPLSLHGRHLATWLVVGLGGLLACWRFVQRARRLLAFRRYRPGALWPLGIGPLRIGVPGIDGGAALLLPNSGGDRDDTTLGTVSIAPGGERQQVRDESGQHLRVGQAPVPRGRELRPGDTLTVPGRDAGGDPDWELDYLGYDVSERVGEVEVRDSPLAVSWPVTVRKLASALVILAAVRWLLGTETVAHLAYAMPFADWLYGHLVFPLLAA